jgi:putative transposase
MQAITFAVPPHSRQVSMSMPNTRFRRCAPNLSVLDRFLLDFWSLFLNPRRILRAAVIIRPSTLLKFHNLLEQRKYRLLYSSAGSKRRPSPKGPSPELIHAIIEMKQRTRRFGCPRIAQQINKTFGTNINKDVVRRILAVHYRPGPGNARPSWLSFLAHTKDSLWSIDLFRCESILLNSHWVLVVMDQFTRRMIGFGIHAGDVDGVALCRRFYTAISSRGSPKYFSSDNDPLFQYHQWQADLRILGTDEIKTVPCTPLSHPFVERLIETIRREFLDHTLFWNAADLERKLETFRQYYNTHRVHSSLDGDTPSEITSETVIPRADLNNFQWQSHCRELFHLPAAA